MVSERPLIETLLNPNSKDNMLDARRLSGAQNGLGSSRSISGLIISRSGPTVSRSVQCARRQRLQIEARAARYDRRKPPPPDLPSLLFDQRIVYLGMPVNET